MKSSELAFVLCVIPIVLLLLFFRRLSRSGGGKSRDSTAEIRRIQTIRQPLRLMKEFRKWSDPEIRRAVVEQLPDPEIAKWLQIAEEKRQREIVSYIDDMERLKSIRSNCTGTAGSSVSGRIDDLVLERITGDPDPAWLASIVREYGSDYVRTKAARALADRKLLGETALWAASASDEKMVRTLLESLDELESAPSGPEAEDVAAAIAGNPAFPAQIRTAAVSHVWDTDTLDRLKEIPGLAAACHAQRCEAICRGEGHQWEMVPESVWEAPSYRLRAEGRRLWFVPEYRCRKCGLTRPGEKSKGEWILKSH